MQAKQHISLHMCIASGYLHANHFWKFHPDIYAQYNFNFGASRWALTTILCWCAVRWTTVHRQRLQLFTTWPAMPLYHSTYLSRLSVLATFYYLMEKAWSLAVRLMPVLLWHTYFLFNTCEHILSEIIVVPCSTLLQLLQQLHCQLHQSGLSTLWAHLWSNSTSDLSLVNHLLHAKCNKKRL